MELISVPVAEREKEEKDPDRGGSKIRNARRSSQSVSLWEDEKPPYRVPSMAEIAAVPKNGLRIVSTFSGCGGSCLGFRSAGYDVLWASEFVPAARETYLANYPETPVDARDIRDVYGDEILAELDLERGELDVLEGSPPCSGFSSAGQREKGWADADGSSGTKKYSDTEQRVDDLPLEYARLVGELLPRAFVMENVAGFMAGAAVSGPLKDTMDALAGFGYLVNARILDASHYGVPQRRQRTIIVGIRKDVSPSLFVYPEPLGYVYTLRDAIADLVDVVHDTKGNSGARTYGPDEPAPAITLAGGAAPVHFSVRTRNGRDETWADVTDEPCPTITTQGIAGRGRIGEEMLEVSIDGLAIGDEWDRMTDPRELGSDSQSTRFFNLIRPHPDNPCPTITQTAGVLGAAGVVHPTEKRKFTIPELKRLFGFPEDFVLTGSYRQQWERLGRSVPPPMMRAVAAALAEQLPPKEER